MKTEELRKDVLVSLGAGSSEIDELTAYNQNIFDHAGVRAPLTFPLPDEPFAAAWERYLAEAGEKGVFACLKERLVQLCFPIQEGISQTEDYKSATRRGVSTSKMSGATGLILEEPGKLELVLHQSPAGRIPLIITREREDFVSLVRALTVRNEPESVPESMGACTVAGYNNWGRIRQYRKDWEKKSPSQRSEEDWKTEFKTIIPRKELYRDRFIILSDGPYSAVQAEQMEISEDKWRDLSLIIRRDHECAHYFTRRVFSSMKNNLIDELIADYMGIVGAAGHFRADWFLRFVGLESFPQYREGARLQNYRGSPPLSDGAFKVLQALVKNAAENVERFDAEHSEAVHSPEGKSRILMALTYLTLEELASGGATVLMLEALGKVPARS